MHVETERIPEITWSIFLSKIRSIQSVAELQQLPDIALSLGLPPEFGKIIASKGELLHCIFKALSPKAKQRLGTSINIEAPWTSFTEKVCVDLGCGGGDGFEIPGLVLLLAAHKATVYGIDLHPQLSQLLKIYTHYQTDIQSTAVPKELEAALITCFLVVSQHPSTALIQHDPDVNLMKFAFETLNSSMEALSVGGVFIIDNPQQIGSFIVGIKGIVEVDTHIEAVDIREHLKRITDNQEPKTN